MQIVDVKKKWTNRINTVTLGATPKAGGGTRAKTVTVGGETTLPFLTFEGEIPIQLPSPGWWWILSPTAGPMCSRTRRP